MKKRIIICLVFCAWVNTNTHAQSSSEKAIEIAAAFNKQKNKSKEKNGQTINKEKNVIARPYVPSNKSDCAGLYEIVGLDQKFQLFQLEDKSWKGEFMSSKVGKDEIVARLKNILIADGLITATLETNDGRSNLFEAAFIERNENGTITHGIGILQPIKFSNGFQIDKAFYQYAQQ